MEFIVNESGCRQLSTDMLEYMKEIARLIAEIEAHNGLLKEALGEDYIRIDNSVKRMASELSNAQSELNVIINDMNEYMSRVHQAKVSLD